MKQWVLYEKCPKETVVNTNQMVYTMYYNVRAKLKAKYNDDDDDDATICILV